MLSLSTAKCHVIDDVYCQEVPKLWTETIDAHRAAVREATLDAAASLVAEHGLVGLTMSQVADRAGIGRATLYKYFPDLHAVLTAWHERQVNIHLEQLVAAADTHGPVAARLEVVLRTYALSQRHSSASHHGELATLLHHGEHVGRARRRLHDFLAELLAQGAQAGDLRQDVAADELADYCLHALSAARTLPSQEAVDRLVAVTLAGLRP
jgi:AcrR family transcriptional regulator